MFLIPEGSDEVSQPPTRRAVYVAVDEAMSTGPVNASEPCCDRGFPPAVLEATDNIMQNVSSMFSKMNFATGPFAIFSEEFDMSFLAKEGDCGQNSEDSSVSDGVLRPSRLGPVQASTAKSEKQVDTASSSSGETLTEQEIADLLSSPKKEPDSSEDTASGVTSVVAECSSISTDAGPPPQLKADPEVRPVTVREEGANVSEGTAYGVEPVSDTGSKSSSSRLSRKDAYDRGDGAQSCVDRVVSSHSVRSTKRKALLPLPDPKYRCIPRPQIVRSSSERRRLPEATHVTRDVRPVKLRDASTNSIPSFFTCGCIVSKTLPARDYMVREIGHGHDFCHVRTVACGPSREGGSERTATYWASQVFIRYYPSRVRQVCVSKGVATT